jgi:hypothetical protein
MSLLGLSSVPVSPRSQPSVNNFSAVPLPKPPMFIPWRPILMQRAQAVTVVRAEIDLAHLAVVEFGDVAHCVATKPCVSYRGPP